MRYLMLVLLFCLTTFGLYAQTILENFQWQTGQVLAVSQRETELATAVFEFMTGSRYGHVGMIVVEEGETWVYEATHPRVRRVPLYDFLETVSLNARGERELTILAPEMDLSQEERGKII